MNMNTGRWAGPALLALWCLQAGAVLAQPASRPESDIPAWERDYRRFWTSTYPPYVPLREPVWWRLDQREREQGLTTEIYAYAQHLEHQRAHPFLPDERVLLPCHRGPGVRRLGSGEEGAEAS